MVGPPFRLDDSRPGKTSWLPAAHQDTNIKSKARANSKPLQIVGK